MSSSYNPLLYSFCEDCSLFHFKLYQRKRSTRGTCYRPACRHIKAALVAWALKTVVLFIRNYGTGEMSAFLTVGDECLLIFSYQQASVVFCRIVECERFAYRDLIYCGYLLD